jgi:hypothetical protein
VLCAVTYNVTYRDASAKKGRRHITRRIDFPDTYYRYAGATYEQDAKGNLVIWHRHWEHDGPRPEKWVEGSALREKWKIIDDAVRLGRRVRWADVISITEYLSGT